VGIVKVKTLILPAAERRFPHNSIQAINRPARTLHKPKKRTCPSCNCSICRNMRRHLAGDRKGNKPSSTSTSASASQKTSAVSNSYFFTAGRGATPPRNALKNSEDAGSRTITSPFLLNDIL